jgi:prepilin-type N-terminal cleavage/methylation domain-containing protein
LQQHSKAAFVVKDPLAKPTIPVDPASEAGFTLVELVVTAVILAIIAGPISAIMLAGAAQAKSARDRTAADQITLAAVERIRTMPYASVGLTGGNPDGVLAATAAASLPGGTAATITTKVTWVSDPIPSAYVTHADYKKVVVTLTRSSDGKQLSQDTTDVASASAPPLAGTSWVQIKRQVVDAVTTSALPGASVNVTGGPNAEDRTDVTDGSGTVLFPALDSDATTSYTAATTLAGYSVFPDDLPPQTPEQITATPGLSSTATIRMYQGASLTVNVQNSSGVAYTGGVTISLASTRCGLATLTIPSGSSSATITTCQWATGKTVPLVPNVLGQTPLFNTYGATAWTAGLLYGGTTGVTVPSNYPLTLSQTMTIKLSATAFTTKTLNVTVTRSGSHDPNARVMVTGGPGGIFSLYGTTNGSGVATFAIPVNATASNYTVSANDMGAASGTAAVNSVTSSTTSPIASAVTIS